jgi:hypothetical protein
MCGANEVNTTCVSQIEDYIFTDHGFLRLNAGNEDLWMDPFLSSPLWIALLSLRPGRIHEITRNNTKFTLANS